MNAQDRIRLMLWNLEQDGGPEPRPGYPYLRNGLARGAGGQGGPRRIDRGYLDAWSVQAVENVSVLDTTGISDHHAVIVDLSRRKLIEGLHRHTSAIAPWSLVV